MQPANFPDRPAWSLKASAAVACVLLGLAGLLLLFPIDRVPPPGVLGQEPEEPLSAHASEFEALARQAGKPLRAQLQELLQTAAGRDEIYATASALESPASIDLIIRVYKRTARASHGKSARRLSEIYDRGLAGVQRDYSTALLWYEVARQNGENLELCCKR